MNFIRCYVVLILSARVYETNTSTNAALNRKSDEGVYER